MSIRCAIVDDEKLAREGLRILLERCEAFDLDVIGEAENVREAKTIMRRARPDVLFLDINMPGKSGFELLNDVDPDRRPLIVFVTAHPEHAVRGFDASAVDYLLKPVSDQRLTESLRRVCQRITEREAVSRSLAMARPVRILINDSGRRTLVDAANIVCIRAAGDYMCVTTRSDELVCRMTLDRLVHALGTQCIRVHRSAAVNPEFVREIVSIGRSRYRIVMDNGISLESSTRFRPSIRRLAARLSG
jgi:two-component system LytT family response regulator